MSAPNTRRGLTAQENRNLVVKIQNQDLALTPRKPNQSNVKEVHFQEDDRFTKRNHDNSLQQS